MHLHVSVPVAVVFGYEPRTSQVTPQKIRWDGREYLVTKVGLHHTYRQGKTLFHVFSVVGQTTFFRLVLNTDNLHWQLEEVSDGEVD